MNHRTILLAGALLASAASSAFGASFRAEVEGNTLIVYSTTDKDEACYSMVTFSYQKDDKRETRRFVCNTFARGQKDFRFCERTDPAFIDLKVEGPVTGTCG